MQVILQNKILELCGQDSKIAEILKLAIEAEEKGDYAIDHLGWAWSDVRAPVHLLRKLVIEGVIKVSYSSRSETNYRLEDREIVRQTLVKYEGGQSVVSPTTLEIPEDIFSPIVGYDDIKYWFVKSLKAEKQVHILLIGPPASAKSMFGLELERIQGAAYYSGTAATRAGIQRFLADTKPHILILDEIDKLPELDQSALFSVMESGVLTELKTGRVRTEFVPVRIYAAGNTDRTLGDALKSRFLTFHLKPYTSQEFTEVVTRVITREGKTEELAEYIADKLIVTSRDPRDAVQTARLCETKEEIDRLSKDLQHYR